MNKILSFISLQLLMCSLVFAQDFTIHKIHFEGLERVPPATIASVLPIKSGEHFTMQDSNKIVRSLYRTGYFEQVSLGRSGNSLIVHVVERPTIGSLKIAGNSMVPTDKLKEALKALQIVQGRVYNSALLEKVKQSLLNQYYQQGHYNARVDLIIAKMSRNRVSVKINISEGLTAKIRRIQILGNHAFSDATLKKQLELSESGLTTFITQTDRYSEEKMEVSLEKLRSYYLDRGYIHFEVKSSQAQVTPDRKGVYVSIVVSEGEPYTIENFSFEGDLVLNPTDLANKITLKKGDFFSREKVIEIEKSISRFYGDAGYMFAAVDLKPRVDEVKHTVSVVFVITAGQRAYIRHVTFSDNTRTNDNVLRREIDQMEAAPAATSKLEESKHRLLMLPYIKNVDMSLNPIPGVADAVDVNYKVTEKSSAEASFKIGYSQLQNLILGAGFNQKNFMGTGNTLGINFQRSKYEQYYGVDYTNPYYTPEGISRSFSFSVSRTTPADVGINTGYTTYEYDAGVYYGIPLGQDAGVYNNLQVGFGYQNTILHLAPATADVPTPLSNQLSDFVDRHGTHFKELDVKLGLTRDSRDRAVFATQGILQNIAFDAYLPLSNRSVTFYVLNYVFRWYVPIDAGNRFIILSKVNLGYGNGLHGIHDFPIFRNYFTGGIDSVRGYEGFTLGPRDSRGKPLGGNILTTAGVNFIFPNPVSDSVRTSWFVDAGNVYTSLNNISYGGASSNSGPIRVTTGLEVDWLSPFGNIMLSLGTRINKRPHDELEVFQFALGANF